MKMKRALMTFGLAALTTAAGLVLIGWTTWTPAAPVYDLSSETRELVLPPRMRSGAEHDAVARRYWPRPYLLQLSAAPGGMYLFGAHHTRDPRDPQLTQMARAWRQFKPTVALYEGRQRGFFNSTVLEPLSGRTEAEAVQQLAHRDGVRLYCLEPRYEDEVAGLLERWSPEQVALYFTTRVYWGESGGKTDDDLALHLLRKRTDVEGLRGSITTVEQLDDVWARELASHGDWRTLQREPKDSWLEQISHDSRRLRGEHLVRTMLDLTKQGERVFVVVGSGHVIRTEWILRSAVGAPPAADQPPNDSITREARLASSTGRGGGGR